MIEPFIPEPKPHKETRWGRLCALFHNIECVLAMLEYDLIVVWRHW